MLLTYRLAVGERVLLRRGDLGKILLVSLFLFVIGAGLMNVANQTVNSGVCAVLAATTPLWLGLLAMFWPNDDRLTPRGWFGLLVGLGGVLLLLVPKVTHAEDLVQNIGVFYLLGSAVSWAIGSLVLRHVRIGTPHLTSAAYQLIFGGAGITLAGVLLGEIASWPDVVTPRAIEAFLYLLLVGSLLGFVAFNWLLQHVAAAKVGTYAYVNPMIAVVVGWAAGEEVTWWLLAGIAVILVGVFLVRGGERRARTIACRDRLVMPAVEAGCGAEP